MSIQKIQQYKKMRIKENAESLEDKIDLKCREILPRNNKIQTYKMFSWISHNLNNKN